MATHKNPHSKGVKILKSSQKTKVTKHNSDQNVKPRLFLEGHGSQNPYELLYVFNNIVDFTPIIKLVAVNIKVARKSERIKIMSYVCMYC